MSSSDVHHSLRLPMGACTLTCQHGVGWVQQVEPKDLRRSQISWPHGQPRGPTNSPLTRNQKHGLCDKSDLFTGPEKRGM